MPVNKKPMGIERPKAPGAPPKRAINNLKKARIEQLMSVLEQAWRNGTLRRVDALSSEEGCSDGDIQNLE